MTFDCDTLVGRITDAVLAEIARVTDERETAVAIWRVAAELAVERTRERDALTAELADPRAKGEKLNQLLNPLVTFTPREIATARKAWERAAAIRALPAGTGPPATPPADS